VSQSDGGENKLEFMPMYLRTLGGLRLEGSSFRRPKPLLLLAYLALEGSKPRRYLAELFFMEASDPMNSLSRALSYLRQEAPGVIEADHKKVWATVGCDATELLNLTDTKRYEKSLELYKGAFALDYDLELSEELEEWLYGTREILAAKARQAFLTLGESEAGKCNFAQAAQLAEKAYRLKEAAELEPDDFGRLYNLLYAGNSPLAAEVREEAEGFEIPLELSREDTRVQLSENVEIENEIPNNLPPPKTSFIGRDQELIEIAQQLVKKDCRLLTLHGMGGIGKSRLAIQAAYDQLKSQQFKDGVYFVALDALSSAELIPSSIAEALGLELQGQEDTLTQVKRFIGKKHLLLVLDNYEHLMAGAILTSELLQVCPNLKLLVTSRERLNVEEEWVLTLDGLSVPTSTEFSEAERFDALHLFVQRAKRAMLEFSLTQETLPHALKICQLVEGSPLGIELAAVWVKTLPVSEIAKEIESNLSVLEAPTKNIPRRHQSIRAVFEHSWKLLTDKEQEVLKKLSIFVGGFRKEAAAEVAGATLPILVSLVDKSLINVLYTGRFNLHSMLRYYTTHKLVSNNQLDLVQKEFVNCIFSFIGERSREVSERTSINALKSIDEEMENLRLAWSLGIQHQLFDLFNKVSELLTYFHIRARYDEGNRLFKNLANSLMELSSEQQKALLGQTLLNQSWLNYQLGDLDEAILLAQRGLDFVRSSPEPNFTELAKGFNIFAMILLASGKIQEAKNYATDAVTMAKKHFITSKVTIYLSNLALIEEELGNYEYARQCYLNVLELEHKSLNIYGVIPTLNNLGHLNLVLGKPKDALTHFLESLDLAREAQFYEQIPVILSNIASTQLQLKNYLEAKEMFFQALQIAWQSKSISVTLDILTCMSELFYSEGNVDLTFHLLTTVASHPFAEPKIKEKAHSLLKSFALDFTFDPKLELPTSLDTLVAVLSNQKNSMSIAISQMAIIVAI
jgi:predicted ATPase